jgi:signal transduction histidine kinase
MGYDVYLQIWGLNGEILYNPRPLNNFATTPFDDSGLHQDYPEYRDVVGPDWHIRVLSIPMEQEGKRLATLQIASKLDVVDAARDDLTEILSIIWIVAVLFSGIAVWVTMGQTLKPLAAITETVEQINRADDLSRRIPYSGPDDDEIGSMVGSFNQTLERLEALFTSQQRLLADVSHELRTPLTVIKGNVDLMRRMKSLDQESLASIDQEAGRLTRLVGGLLLLAQAETGKLALVMGKVELDLLITEVFQEMSILAASKLRLHLNEIDQVYVNGDRDRLKQVFINLVANSIQYTPQGGDVYLSLEQIKEQARVIVRDTGPGIPAEDLPHIFERFYRAEKSRTRGKSTGFGLGLSIANWIVEKHGGRIEVVSQEGKGTTFAVWLPLFGNP